MKEKKEKKRMMFFYLATTGWIFDISLLYENSINQSIKEDCFLKNNLNASKSLMSIHPIRGGKCVCVYCERLASY